MPETLTFTDIIDFIDKYWDSFKLDTEKPKEFAVIAINIRRSGDHATRCFKVLNKADSTPVLIIKMPQKPGSPIAEKSLSTEYNTIKKLRINNSLSTIKDTIPVPIEFTKLKGVPILIEKAFLGNNLELLIGVDPEENIASIIFEKTLDWLYKVHMATQDKKFIFNEGILKTYFTEPLEYIEKKLGQNLSTTHEYIYNQIKRLSVFKGLEINLSLTHGDFNPWNIILQKNDSFGIVDWEDVGLADFFLRDLFYFIIVYTWELFCGLKAKEKYKLQGKPYFDNKLNWYSSFIKEKLFHFFKLINLPAESIDLFFLLFIIRNTIIDLDDKRNKNIASAKRWLDILSLKFDKDIFFNYIRHTMESSILNINK